MNTDNLPSTNEDHQMIVNVVQIPTSGWIPAEQYYAIYKESKGQIDERIKNKYWIKGKHYNQPKGSKQRWINIEAINQWAAGLDQAFVASQAAS